MDNKLRIIFTIISSAGPFNMTDICYMRLVCKLMKQIAEDSTYNKTASVRCLSPYIERPVIKPWFNGTLIIKYSICNMFDFYTVLFKRAKQVITIKKNEDYMRKLKLSGVQYIEKHEVRTDVGYICPNGMNISYTSDCCKHIYQYYPGEYVPENFFRKDYATRIYCKDCNVTWHCLGCQINCQLKKVEPMCSHDMVDNNYKSNSGSHVSSSDNGYDSHSDI